ETIWHFTKHAAAPRALALGPGEEILAEAAGRAPEWTVYKDTDPLVADFPSFALACRCSSSVPFIFEPAQCHVHFTDGPAPDPEELSTDGPVRDNSSLGAAVKLAGCDRVFGMFLGSIDYSDQPWGGLLDLAQRTLDQMGRTIFEADQDDSRIRQTPIRTL